MPSPVPGRRSFLATAIAAAGLAGGVPGAPQPAQAAALPLPAGKPILAVSGKIANTNDGAKARFDIPMLEALGKAGFTTSTPWYDRPVLFEGVPMARLMAAVGAAGTVARVIALDDYATDVPIEDFARWGTLLALKIDGKYLSVAEKGPGFIVYPYDQHSELRDAKYYTRSVWQVASIEVI